MQYYATREVVTCLGRSLELLAPTKQHSGLRGTWSLLKYLTVQRQGRRSEQRVPICR